MEKAEPAFRDPATEAAFADFDEDARTALLRVRAMIFDVARSTQGVGRLEETLKWGQPSYLTPETKSGSTIRLGAPNPGSIAIFAHCQTSIISDFAAHFSGAFSVEGNRAVHVKVTDLEAAEGPIRHLIASALTYHKR
ncbi:DUF1801 domain-containing protein [Celeribacter arenosi]|uniref:DUF1801 domain-containing protein n=1 Tax=Celeribacter arenosi TaxID=792649 RepID=A0ABP7K6K7_9RHOB